MSTEIQTSIVSVCCVFLQDSYNCGDDVRVGVDFEHAVRVGRDAVDAPGGRVDSASQPFVPVTFAGRMRCLSALYDDPPPGGARGVYAGGPGVLRMRGALNSIQRVREAAVSLPSGWMPAQ